MIDEVTNYLTANIPLKLQEDPIDMYPAYESLYSQMGHMTTMPPSPGVKLYAVFVDYEPSSFTAFYKMDVEWCEFMRDLVKRMPSFQITHRSREFACGIGTARINEMDRKVARMNELKHEIPKIQMPERISDELYSILINRTKEYSSLSHGHILDYIRDHKSASMGQGIKWGSAFQVPIGDWTSIYDLVQENLEVLDRYRGYYGYRPFNVGMRARSNEVSGFANHYENEIELTRQIWFAAWASIYTLFIPNKVGWYRSIFNDVDKLFNPQLDETWIPFDVGGQVMLKARDFHAEGLPFHAYDGKVFDACVGSVLGPIFRPLMTTISGYDMLPTGCTFTSPLNTIVMKWLTRNVKGKSVMSGDDFNFWGPTTTIPSTRFLELEPNDTIAKFTLGVGFEPDIERPRLYGLKVTSDRAKKMRPIPAYERVAVSESRDERVRALWAGMYFGWYGKDTLLNRLAHVKPGDYVAPEELVERLIEKEFEVKEVDPFAWAEREGIKMVV